MTFREALLSLQLMAEEKVGAPRRETGYRAKAEEDAAFEAVRAAVKEHR